jgi:MFS family permease
MARDQRDRQARADERDLRLFVAYRFLSRFYFHLPVLLVYLLTGGLSILAVELLLAAYGLVIVVASPWSRRLVERWSLRTVVGAGEALKVVGVGLLAISPDLGTALPGQLIGALGYSLAAGTDSALLGALAGGDRDLYGRYERTSATGIFVGALIGGVIGALLFTVDEHLPFVASVVVSAAACAAVLRMREVEAAAPAGGRGPAGPPPALPGADRFWLHYYAVTRAFALAPYVGFLPYLFFVVLEVEVGWFGVILGIYGLTSMVVARNSGRLADRFGPRRLGWLSMAMCATALAVIGAVPTLWGALLGVFGLGLGGGVVRPVTMTNLDRAIGGWTGAQRTALLSGQERLYGAWNTAILVVGGLLLEAEVGVRPLIGGLAAAYVAVLGAMAFTSTRRAAA